MHVSFLLIAAIEKTTLNECVTFYIKMNRTMHHLISMHYLFFIMCIICAHICLNKFILFEYVHGE